MSGRERHLHVEIHLDAWSHDDAETDADIARRAWDHVRGWIASGFEPTIRLVDGERVVDVDLEEENR